MCTLRHRCATHPKERLHGLMLRYRGVRSNSFEPDNLERLRREDAVEILVELLDRQDRVDTVLDVRRERSKLRGDQAFQGLSLPLNNTLLEALLEVFLAPLQDEPVAPGKSGPALSQKHLSRDNFPEPLEIASAQRKVRLDHVHQQILPRLIERALDNAFEHPRANTPLL